MSGFVRLDHVLWLVVAAVLLTPVLCGDAWAQQKTDAQMIAEWKADVLDLTRITRHTDGEDITWLATPYLRGMVTMAEATGDRDCLDAFCSAWEYLQSIASEDIDGLYGWPTAKGSYGRQGRRCIPMDDGIITEKAAEFVRVVRSDPELKKVYGERAESYLKWVEERIWPKWEDSWLELSGTVKTTRRIDNEYQSAQVELTEPAGVYRFYNPGKEPGMSLPVNQFLHVAMCYLSLYDVTGKDFYLEKAERIGSAAKQIYLVPVEDRWDAWCYWQPVWPGDYKSDNQPVHWVGPHPNRPGYAAGEVGMMARLHERGLVFSDEDMQRFVRRQLDVMWNKDLASPEFEFTVPNREEPYPGSLWSSLAYLDPTIAKMASRDRGREALERMSSWQRINGLPGYLLRQKEAAE